MEAQVLSLGRALDGLAGDFDAAGAAAPDSRGRLARGGGREGSGALPWPRAAAVSTRLRHSSFESSLNLSLARISSSACRVRVRGLGSGLGSGLGLGLGVG